ADARAGLAKDAGDCVRDVARDRPQGVVLVELDLPGLDEVLEDDLEVVVAFFEPELAREGLGFQRPVARMREGVEDFLGDILHRYFILLWVEQREPDREVR